MAGTVCSSGWLSDAAEDEDALSGEAVSYTHLTLPTKLEV